LRTGDLIENIGLKTIKCLTLSDNFVTYCVKFNR